MSAGRAAVDVLFWQIDENFGLSTALRLRIRP